MTSTFDTHAGVAVGDEEMEEMVVLVDGEDSPLGTAGKLRAHRERLLHRAFSLFVFDARGQLLLQRRAAGKYHSAGLWSNACCGHPRPGESVEAAAARRLHEEMGLRCEVERVSAFTYIAALDGGLWEHEYDHVLVGRTDAEPRPDPREVGAWRRLPLDDLRREMRAAPERFTAWLAPALEELLARRKPPDGA
ncbi:MAG TPA: isopentenyl-diphosphate Delta-isomerase [Gemmatimonadaceae bacterium]|nr:isopentenyl-diphosphate Delta-isomerase [Gemmatimonadaceae bacterium]